MSRIFAWLRSLAPSALAWRGAAWGLIAADLAFLGVMARDELALREPNWEHPSSELVFQVFDLPLADFAEVNPLFDPAELRTVRFVFDRTRRRVIVLDDVGFRPPSS